MSVSLKYYRDLLHTYLRPQWPSVMLLALLLLGSIGLELLNPQIVRAFIDAAARGDDLAALIRGALLFIAVALLGQFVSVAVTYASERVGWTATNQLRGDLALHCMGLDMAFHKNHTPGEMIERIDGDVTAMASFFSQFVFQVLGSGLLLVGALVLLWLENWRVGLALTLFALVALAALVSCRNLGVRYEVAESEASADLYGFLEERLAGIDDLRANGAGGFVLRRFAGRQRDLAGKERTAAVMAGRLWVVASLIFSLGYALALALGVYFYQANLMSIGSVFLLFQYTELLRSPLEQLARQFQNLQEASAGLLRVQELYRLRPLIHDGGAAPLAPGPLPVAFESVMFGYDDQQIVLHDLSLRLGPGKVLGVLGRTGSGKTTLTRLLLRLYDPSAGRVCLGERDISELPLANLRERVGIVTQDVQLFHASLRDNLTMFDSGITDQRILDVIERLGLASWYHGLRGGLDGELQPDGVSAGQAQLLAFARVFLQDPGLVILDEASSRLDPVTEQLIERAVDRLLHNRTGIIIAHRLETVQRVDEIAIMEAGRIAEQGPRAALASDPDSRFAQLLRVGLEDVLA